MTRLLALIALLLAPLAQAAIPAAPDRDEGEGPYPQLVLRGATRPTGRRRPHVAWSYAPLAVGRGATTSSKGCNLCLPQCGPRPTIRA